MYRLHGGQDDMGSERAPTEIMICRTRAWKVDSDSESNSVTLHEKMSTNYTSNAKSRRNILLLWIMLERSRSTSTTISWQVSYG